MTDPKPVSGREGATGRDPVVEAYKRGIDQSLLRENLKKTPTERIEGLMELQRLAEEARRAGRASRSS